jgi:arsenical pump membrane protein
MNANQAALPILVLTVSLALVKPRLGRIKIGHATAAILGALLSIMTGAVSLQSAYQSLHVLVYPVITIISLMILTIIAEQAGLFGLLALQIAKIAKGDGKALFTYLFFAGTLTGAIFTNDAAVLIFTPLVYKLIEEVKGESWGLSNKIPYYFAVLYVANLVGAFVISNPINIIVASFFGIEFHQYAMWMVFPALVSVITTYCGLRMFFKSSLPRRYERSPANESPRNPRFMALSGTVLVLTLLTLFLEHLTGVPTWAAAFTGAMTLLILSGLIEGSDNIQVIRAVGWDVIVFVVGIFIVVTGLRNAGLTNSIQGLLTSLAGFNIFKLTLASAFIAATCSAIMNNHPTAYAMALAIQDMHVESLLGNGMLVKKMLVFSALIGGDLGPKMLPIGSLAALLWFRILRDRGVHISYSLYIKIGIPVTLAAVLLSVIALNLEIALVGLLSRIP